MNSEISVFLYALNLINSTSFLKKTSRFIVIYLKLKLETRVCSK